LHNSTGYAIHHRLHEDISEHHHCTETFETITITITTYKLFNNIFTMLNLVVIVRVTASMTMVMKGILMMVKMTVMLVDVTCDDGDDEYVSTA